jgi:hypothetical protein
MCATFYLLVNHLSQYSLQPSSPITGWLTSVFIAEWRDRSNTEIIDSYAEPATRQELGLFLSSGDWLS